MLLELFASLHVWGENLTGPRLRLIVGVLFAAGLVITGAAAGLALGSGNPWSMVAGCAAGVAWIVAGNLTYWFLLPDRRREQWDVRSRMVLSRRRWVAVVAVLVWFSIVLAAGRTAGNRGFVLLGALNVVFLVYIARFGVADDAERQEWSNQKEFEVRQRAFVEAFEKGLIDEDGNPTPLARAGRRAPAEARRRWPWKRGPRSSSTPQ